MTINAILPAFVATSLAPPGLIESMPKEVSLFYQLIIPTRVSRNNLQNSTCFCKGLKSPQHLTPMSTIIKAYDTFIGNGDLSGETVEVSQDQLFFREQVEYPSESQRWINETDFWSLMYQRKEKGNAD